MTETIDIPKLLALRKLTKAISAYLEQELKSYLGALAPAFHPGLLFGEHIQGIRQTVKGSGDTFKSLSSLYQSLSKTQPFSNRLDDIKSPLPVFGRTLQITPVEYDYKANDGSETKNIRMHSPLKWSLGYRDQGIKNLKELLAAQARSGDTSLDVCVLHHIVMHFMAVNEKGGAKILKALRFEINSEPSAKLGGLPLVYISSPVSTVRPQDELIIRSTELSGTPYFEEIVNLDDIAQLTDPLKERLVALAEGHRGQ